MIDLSMKNTEDNIRKISEYYDKKTQWHKTMEELEELQDELCSAANPFSLPYMVNMTDNTWSECADVIIMIAQLAMQHGKEDKVREQIEFKVNRQLERISEENLPEWKVKFINTFLGGR